LKSFPFRLGLDLSGGSHLIYKADISGVAAGQVSTSMDALRDVIERRVNLFGVSEPVVQVQNSSFISGGAEELIVDLPGVTDVDKATEMIGQTPLLEFKTEAPAGTPQKATVDANGKVVNPLVVKKVHPLLDAEAIRVISGLPNWKPGLLNGKAVNVCIYLPINFSLI